MARCPGPRRPRDRAAQSGAYTYEAGGVSRLPVIRGLADERLRLQIDGMDLYAACPNHMNTPLSYLDPGQVERVRVWAGIAPVSAGGDAIGGVVAAETPAPTFAAPGQTGTRGEVGVSARSNGHAWGQWGVRGQLSYLKGRNRSTGDGLYQILPLNARVSLTHRAGAWDSAVELVAVRAKTDVSQVRNEVRTPGFALLNVRTAYRLGRGKLELGIDNLFDRLYYLPTGGAYVGQGTTMTNPTPPNVPQWGTAVPGPGRTVWVTYQQTF
ncbi:TonB-dependent receptor plug domain-containing protein [Tepidimonas fonticaldi]|uniref:TonB-dependent receptor plug domain-containing protein n=1 Tax=Tepidimonas fonticaldi TaxID=1101373 RepID=UPI001C8F84FE|nr:TonB-dependent receptor plug domain-containing protein [Tepidimonas fonticaldi]